MKQNAPLALALLLPFVIGCGSTSDSNTCFESGVGDVRIDSLLEATARFSTKSQSVDTRIRAACNAMATDLGAATSDDTKTACENAVAAIDGVYAANAEVAVTISYIPPVCAVDVNAIVDCTAMCDVSFDATATPPTCEGGELSGGCSGSCEGSCTVEGTVNCEGTCSGSCSGECSGTVNATCTGTCNGQCDGTCSATNADGTCAGTCTGTCRGTCTGSIEGKCTGMCGGSCEGSCEASVTGSCEGTCSGSCDVEFTAPKCEGGELNVQADADCKAACEADASFDVACTEPEVVVTFTGSVTSESDVAALVATIEANYGTIVAAAAELEGVASATADLATRLGGAVTAAASIGVEAADCVRQAVSAQVEAAARINVSIEASVSVSGSVSGSSS